VGQDDLPQTGPLSTTRGPPEGNLPATHPLSSHNPARRPPQNSPARHMHDVRRGIPLRGVIVPTKEVRRAPRRQALLRAARSRDRCAAPALLLERLPAPARRAPTPRRRCRSDQSLITGGTPVVRS
jgi:hypothetical protein